MPGKNFRDDVSTLSEGGRDFFSRARSATRGRSRSRPRNRHLSSSSSVTSHASSSGIPSRGKGIFGSLRSSSRFGRKNGAAAAPDDVSVPDSLCSGVLRDLDGSVTGGSLGGGSAHGGVGAMSKSKRSMGAIGASGRSGVGSVSASGRSYSVKETPPVTGGVADFNSDSNTKPSIERGGSVQSDISSGTGPSSGGGSARISSGVSEAARRELRKERVREKLERYKGNQKQLKHSCAALEKQLAQTTEKLKEVDSKAAFKIDALESELRETRGGLERVARQSTKEVSDQGEVIKTLGKKLIRQAHVIKKQKGAVDQYKMKLQQLQEEMNMQDERDSQRAEEYCELRDQFDKVLEQKTQMQNILQENIEEMMDLKNETERDAKSIMELKLNLQQKDVKLERVEKEATEKNEQVSRLKMKLEEKSTELEDTAEKLKTSETKVEAAESELERMNKEVEELRTKCLSPEKINEGGRVGALLGALNVEERTPSMVLRGWNRDTMDAETFEDALQAKDLSIQRLDQTVTDHEETIQTLRSDMVKMSSTYKQDSYLKRKEIAKLKQANAEYALKLRALEKAFKSIGGSSADIASSMHGMSAAACLPMGKGGSRHGKSMHSPIGGASPTMTKEGKEAAVKARLGGLAPYEFPSSRERMAKEPRIVVDSNFFVDASESGSEEARKGEFPEEH